MNIAVISKDKLIETANDIIENDGLKTLSMRLVAKKCNIALGSIYNYFPTKFDLVIAVIESNWNKIFYPALSELEHGKNFTDMVESIYQLAQQNFYKNGAFFSIHPSIVAEKDYKKAREVMLQYFSKIHEILLASLNSDEHIKTDVWSIDFTKEKFVEFVFSNMITMLSNKEKNCEYLIQVIKRLVY